jgi:carbonic anhydrase/acetyltransferase-like protein (isoleucine patch superfamily)
VRDSRFVSFRGHTPSVGRDAFVADTARVIGDVQLGDLCSVWYGAVIRGDVFHVRIGHNVNIQDMAMIHVTTDRFETRIGDDVTIGHRASLHGCTVRQGALVGMGATILDEAVVGEGAMVGAGALVTPGTKIDPHTLWTGVPAKFRRVLTPDERSHLAGSASHYVNIAATYLEIGVGRVEEGTLRCTD